MLDPTVQSNTMHCRYCHLHVPDIRVHMNETPACREQHAAAMKKQALPPYTPGKRICLNCGWPFDRCPCGHAV